MTIYAAELSHMGVIVLLLNVASVGTVLHTGLKLPYFTWFGTNRSLKPAPVPPGMHLGMALAAGLCLTIGIYPAVLYNLLPFAANYQPYTTVHLIETMQLLVFAGLGFWLLIGKLGGEAVITLDTDWFYRKPSRFAYTTFVVYVSNIFAAIERLTTNLVRFIVKLSANPVGYAITAGNLVKSTLFGVKRPKPEPYAFDANRYRIPLLVMILIVLAGFVILIAWSFAGS